jgi:hypothetical protein
MCVRGFLYSLDSINDRNRLFTAFQRMAVRLSNANPASAPTRMEAAEILRPDQQIRRLDGSIGNEKNITMFTD